MQPIINSGVGMLVSRLRAFIALWILSTCFFMSGAHAADLSLAESWLRAQQAADGSFPSSIATLVQSTDEARNALLAGLPDNEAVVSAATAFLDGYDGQLHESLARVHGASAQRGALAFWETRSASPGWGDFDHYPSTASSTAMVLQAAARRQWRGAPVDAAISFLKSSQLPSGGWNQAPNPESMLVTTYAVDALRGYQFTHAVSGSLQSAVNFLIEELTLRGDQWPLFQRALVLRAVAPFLSDTSNVTGAVNSLEDSQRLDGSWEADAYTTALAMQALAAVGNLREPVDRANAAIYGRLVDGATGLPVSGETVRLGGGPAAVQARTDRSGSFFFGALPAGGYTISVQTGGWESVSVMLSVQAREFRSTGDIVLQVPAGTARLSGEVRRADTLETVAGVRLAFSGLDPQIRFSGPDGAFAATFSDLPPAVTATRAGYESARIGLDGVPGNSFIPVMLAALGETPLAGPLFTGRVLDARSGDPVAGAQVTLSSGSLITDDAGHYETSQFAADTEQLQVSAPGYLSVTRNIVTSGSTLVHAGDVYLRPTAGQVALVHGTVVHATTGSPIYGARIDLNGQVATASMNGQFSFDVGPGQALPMEVSAPGFLPISYVLDTDGIGAQGLVFAMQPAGRGNVAVSDWSASATSFDAYQLVQAQAVLANEGAQTTRVLLFAKVYNAADTLVDTFPVPVDLASGDYALQLAPGEFHSQPVRWFTRNHPPGDYRLVFEVHSERGDEVWAERHLPLTIMPTRRIDNARLYATPTALYGDALQPVALYLNMRNRSNVPWVLPVSYSLLAPDGSPVFSGAAEVALSPEALRIEAFLEEPALQLQAPGRYRLLPSLGGSQTASAGVIDRLPDIRIEMDAQLTPEVVTPDGDKVIRATIELQGEEAP